MRARKNERMRKEGWLLENTELSKLPKLQNEEESGYDYVGLKVKKYFEGYGEAECTVVGYLPPSKNDGYALWHLVHEDGDSEDWDNEEILQHFPERPQRKHELVKEKNKSQNHANTLLPHNRHHGESQEVLSSPVSENEVEKVNKIRVGTDYQVSNLPTITRDSTGLDYPPFDDEPIWKPEYDTSIDGSDETSRLNEFLKRAHLVYLVPGLVVQARINDNVKFVCCVTSPHRESFKVVVYDGYRVYTIPASNCLGLSEDILLNIWNHAEQDIFTALTELKGMVQDILKKQFSEHSVATFFALRSHFKNNISRMYFRSILRHTMTLHELMAWFNAVFPVVTKKSRRNEGAELISVYKCADALKHVGDTNFSVSTNIVSPDLNDLVDGNALSSDDENENIEEFEEVIDNTTTTSVTSVTSNGNVSANNNVATSDTSKNNIKTPSRGKPVEQIDLATGKVVRRYSSGNVAAKYMDCSRNALSAVCRGSGNGHSYVNFGWRFYHGPTIDCNDLFIDIVIIYLCNMIFIFVVDNNPEELWYEPLDKLLKIRYADEESNDKEDSEEEEEDIAQPGNVNHEVVEQPPKPKLGKPVEQIDPETGKVVRRYYCGTEAARIMGCSQGSMSTACLRDNTQICGYKWRYYTGPEIDCK
jgi:hypothetical protein